MAHAGKWDWETGVELAWIVVLEGIGIASGIGAHLEPSGVWLKMHSQ